MTKYPWIVTVAFFLLGCQAGLSHGECDPGITPAPQLEPHFTKPTSNRLELLPGDSTSLVCEVDRVIDLENPPTDGLLIWWCNSTYRRCHQDAQSMINRRHIYLSATESDAQDASHLRSEFNLTDVVPSEADLYFCVAYSEDDASSTCPGSVAVDVVIKRKSAPTIINHTQRVEVSKGSPFNLTCIADGYPTPAFTWRKDGKPIKGGESGTLQKQEADVSDTGSYTCVAANQIKPPATSPGIKVEVHDAEPEGLSTLTLALLIAAAVVLSILLLIIILRLSRLRSNMTCCTLHRTSVRGDHNTTIIEPRRVNVYNDRRGSHLSRGDSSHERQTFLHDVFIHNHSSDNQFAQMIRSKLQDRESHLKVGLWSEVPRPDRSSSRNKLLRLRLVNCTRIVILVSEGYLKTDYHALVSALAKSRAKPESIRNKIIIIRMLEENKIPKDLAKNVMASFEYNVETDSCYFWPKFLKAVMPNQTEILYWV